MEMEMKMHCNGNEHLFAFNSGGSSYSSLVLLFWFLLPSMGRELAMLAKGTFMHSGIPGISVFNLCNSSRTASVLW